MAVADITLEKEIRATGQRILDAAAKEGPSFFRGDWWDSRVMEWAMKDEALKVQLFRFIDVLPALKSPEEIAAHLKEYLASSDRDFPALAQWGLQVASAGSLAARAMAATVRSNTVRMARRFIAGSDFEETASVLKRLHRQKMAFTVDILGEATVSEMEAEGYQSQYLRLIRDLAGEAARWNPVPLLDESPSGPLPRVNVSVKLSSLYSQMDPIAPGATGEALKERLRPILREAKDSGAFINLDIEQYTYKDLILRVFREILEEPEFLGWGNVGIAIQAYLRDSEEDIGRLISWARGRQAPVTVRLVRGAYWDYETVIARQRGWPVPVYTRKWETDINYELCTRLLLEAYPEVHTAVGSHNIRSIAYAIACAHHLGLPSNAFEVQMLYGMGDPIKVALVDMGQRVRVYTPFGELIPGMAYLVRRLLENTSNQSFLRMSFAEGVSAQALLRSPEETAKMTPAETKEAEKSPGFVNEPERDFSKEEHREAMRQALIYVRTRIGQQYPLVIGDEEILTGQDLLVSINPSRPSEVVGRVASARVEEAGQAIRTANEAFLSWGKVSPEKRAEYLLAMADIMRRRRDELAAWEVLEVGKNWREAAADVVESIDYLVFYSKEMLRLGRPQRMGDAPGEVNEYFYRPRGVAVIIPPWNFPLAILTGMTAAALVAGNSVIVKPASLSPVIGAKLFEIFREAKLPEGVANFLPGPGGEIGDFLVSHPQVHLIAFTGSREVGCRIFRRAAEVYTGQQHLKRVIAEMGGKNAVIVDADADLDDAIEGVIVSAFGYQGQKCSACSRVIVLESIYPAFLGRLVEAARSLRIGPAEDPANFMGPVIEEAALRKILRYIEMGKTEARTVLETDVSHLKEGFFVGPTIFSDVPPEAAIAQEEIFGPVLSVIRASDFDQALDIAENTSYALTGGLFSRSPVHIRRAREEWRVGNLYINRKITGAIVGRQPFGGFKMSGIGSKAGGPDYLLQFMEPQVSTENTLRRGFAPDTYI